MKAWKQFVHNLIVQAIGQFSNSCQYLTSVTGQHYAVFSNVNMPLRTKNVWPLCMSNYSIVFFFVLFLVYMSLKKLNFRFFYFTVNHKKKLSFELFTGICNTKHFCFFNYSSTTISVLI